MNNRVVLTNFMVGNFPSGSLRNNLTYNDAQINILRLGPRTNASAWLLNYHTALGGYLRLLCILGDLPSNQNDRITMHTVYYQMMVYEERFREQYAMHAGNYPHLLVLYPFNIQ